MKARKIILRLALIAVLSWFVLLPGVRAQTSRALSKQDVIHLLEGKVSAERVEELAREKGISFQVTPETETEMRNAGATNALLSALRSLAPKPMTPTPAPGETKSNLPKAGASERAVEEPLPAGMDPELADLYRRAAGGWPDAMIDLGLDYYRGEGVPKDYKQAVDWFRKAAEAFRKAAEAGNTLGMVYLADMYHNGYGVEKDDKQALSWARKAAEAGNVQGMVHLSAMYFNGWGVNKDYNQAVTWSRKAAEAGDADGMYNLGVMYFNGWGVNKDYNQAVSWYRKAAEAGDAGG